MYLNIIGYYKVISMRINYTAFDLNLNSFPIVITVAVEIQLSVRKVFSTYYK